MIAGAHALVPRFLSSLPVRQPGCTLGVLAHTLQSASSCARRHLSLYSQVCLAISAPAPNSPCYECFYKINLGTRNWGQLIRLMNSMSHSISQ